MKLQEFLNELFNQESVKGYGIGRLEVSVMVYDHEPDESKKRVLHICCPEMAMAKIVIVPMEKENAE